MVLILTILFSLQSFAQDTTCVWQDGYYRNYVGLITDNIPDSDFNKTDFINHLITNSNPSTSELDFLNTSITEVSLSFPSSQVGSSQKVVTVVSDSNAMNAFLIAFSESFDWVEPYCEILLGRDEFDLAKGIKIYPNPVSDNSYIQIDHTTAFKSLKIYDITGKLMYSKEIENLNLIEFSEFKLSNGIYILKFISDHLAVSKKIIYKSM
ncbi:T9SS type A sorting domain-containing protein [Pustulibacterium marinum]|nr:T9SS type A sorting domain-containing protein [Pustulibacterium marinum]